MNGSVTMNEPGLYLLMLRRHFFFPLLYCTWLACIGIYKRITIVCPSVRVSRSTATTTYHFYRFMTNCCCINVLTPPPTYPTISLSFGCFFSGIVLADLAGLLIQVVINQWVDGFFFFISPCVTVVSPLLHHRFIGLSFHLWASYFL